LIYLIFDLIKPVWSNYKAACGPRAGLTGGNGSNCPSPAERGIPWWNLFVSNKILV